MMRATRVWNSSLRFARSGGTLVRVAVFAIAVGSCAPWASGQTGSVGSLSLRPFVTAVIPVVGRGRVVGGVSVDAAGVVSRTDIDSLGRLRDLRSRALGRVDSELAATSGLRKVSLRGIVEEIARRRMAEKPVSDELQNLAGLQRVQFALVYPEQRDIVLAGFAEGWRVDPSGNVVGQTTGDPVLQLDDLIVALRTARQAADGEGISCSIDPTAEGTKRLQRLLATRGLQLNEATVARLEATLGPQQITVTGVPSDSHFALVLVAADFMMKRLGMNFEPAPVPEMPSYMEMLQASGGSATRTAMPRFWLAPSYDAILKDPDGLAWQLRGSGVQAFAEDRPAAARGTLVSSTGKSDSLAQRWADTMTAKYDALSQSLPVFRELRNCIDLAVVAALLTKEDLPARAGCDLSLLLDEKRVRVAESHVPRITPSRVSVVPKGRQWIVSISGGVMVDSWSVLKRVEVQPALSKTYESSAPGTHKRWWWD